MNSIRAITLDLDDTLWAIEPVIEKAEQALWQFLADSYPRVVENFSAADVHDIRVSVMEEYTDYWHDFRFLRKKVLERIATSAGYSPDLVEPAFAIFDRARNDVELFPDVLPDLETLSQHFTLVALTNGNANLDTIGIGHFFEAVIAAADVGVSKPAKQIFDVAVATAGFHPSEVLHVGDHPKQTLTAPVRRA